MAQPLSSSASPTAKAVRKPRQSPKSATAPPPPIGDNSGEVPGPSEAEQREAVYRIRMAGVRRNLAEVDKIRSVLKAAQKGLTTARNEFKRDTGIELQDLDYVLRRSELIRTDIAKRQDHINWMLELEGLPLGGQQSLFAQFDKRPTLIRDQADWESEGRRAFNRGGDRTPPESVPGEFHQAYMTGYDAELERTAWAMAMVHPIDRDTNIGASAPELDPEPEDAAEIDPDEVEAQARKLARSGFMETGGEEPVEAAA